MDNLNLEEIRKTLEKLEDRIIFGLYERAGYKTNGIVYTPGRIETPTNESFFYYVFHETQKFHATLGRFDNPEEIPFFNDLPTSNIKHKKKQSPIKNIIINLNPDIQKAYLNALQSLCEKGDDGEHGLTVLCDIKCLDDLSRRIHFGRFVAEAKFQAEPSEYSELIDKRDIRRLTDKLRDIGKEKEILDRVSKKGLRYGINPEFVMQFYRDKVIPLTIEVELKYLLN